MSEVEGLSVAAGRLALVLRTSLAVAAGRAARVAARLRGGGGSALPGLLAERIQAAGRGDPAVVEVARTLQREMAIRQDYGDEYALAGYVLAPR